MREWVKYMYGNGYFLLIVLAAIACALTFKWSGEDNVKPVLPWLFIVVMVVTLSLGTRSYLKNRDVIDNDDNPLGI